GSAKRTVCSCGTGGAPDSLSTPISPPASPPPTTTRFRPGSMPPAAEPSPGLRPGTATRWPWPATRASPRCSTASPAHSICRRSPPSTADDCCLPPGAAARLPTTDITGSLGAPMKIAYDPTPLHPTHRLLDFPSATADLGYDFLQLTPNPDFATHFRYPKMDRDLIRRFARAVEAAGITVPALLPVQRISWPDEAKRAAAVKNFRRVIEIAVDLGVKTINTEFSGRPEAFEDSEESFYRSMDELLPIIERDGMRLNIDPHPDDFVEDGHEAWRVLRGLDSASVGFVYVASHTFHYGDCLTTLADELGE